VDELGIDVDFNKGTIVWQGAKDDGVVFAGIRWGQRRDWRDSQRLANWTGARSVGIARMGYWVWDERGGDGALSHWQGLSEVADEFGDDWRGELPLAVDVEKAPVSWDELRQFLLLVEADWGRKPTIYSGSWILEELAPLPEWLSEYEWWVTGYNNVGPDVWGPFADLHPTVVCWQQSEDWRVSWSSAGYVDRDYWQGDLGGYLMPRVVNLDDLVAWLDAHGYECEPPAPPPIGAAFALASPLPVPLSQHRISQEFNANPQWYAGVGGHDGVDFAIPEGTPVLASHAGKVTVSGYRPDRPTYDPYGDHVRIEQAALDLDGQERVYTTIYGHLDRLDVQVGATVEKGQQVGLSGGVGSRAGNSTGPHLHFGVVCRGAQSRGETFLAGDFASPWLWLKDLPERVISAEIVQRRKTLTALNIRNVPMTDGSLVRRTMAVGVTFSVYEVRSGWGAIDFSRTGWSSLNPSYSGVA